MKKIFAVVVSVLTLTAIFLVPTKTSALVVSFPVIEISADPGQTVSKKITLENETATSTTFTSSIYNFKANGVDGKPILEPLPKDGGVDLASWIVAESGPITLAPKQTMQTEIVINVPKNADPGGHYAAVLWGNDAEAADAGSGATVGWKMGNLILLRVSGDVDENAKITSFNSNQGAYSSLPVKFITDFKNDGNVHLKPTGQITIKGMFGTTSTIIPINKTGGNVLPKSTRTYEDVWVKDEKAVNTGAWLGLADEWKNFGIGRYTANAAFVVGESQKVINESVTFWVIPWRTIVLVIILIAIAVFLVKKYNAMIIKKAGKARKKK